MHRRAVDAVRREQRRRTEPLEQAPDLTTAGADDDALLRFERERVQSALAQLPDPQREALELAYFGGFTQAELADRLGQPLGTIKSRMFSGLRRLAELLGEVRVAEHPQRDAVGDAAVAVVELSERAVVPARHERDQRLVREVREVGHRAEGTSPGCLAGERAQPR